MIFMNGQIIVYDPIDERTQHKAQVFVATVQFWAKESKNQ
jgi:hypothetical protein